MTLRTRLAALGFSFALVLTVAAGWIWFGPKNGTDGLDGLEALLAARKFDEAERRLEAELRRNPQSTPANILMAQVAMNRDEPNARRALDHLHRVRSDNRSTLAFVKLYEGKAYSELGRYDRAETSWLEALRLDPLVPEAGWALLGLYYVEGRRAEARTLGLLLHAREPDPHDHAQLLLELIRQDAQPLSPQTLLKNVGPAVEQHPEDLYAALAVGKAHVRNSQAGEGLPILRRKVEQFRDNPAAWEALCWGLEESARTDELAAMLESLPAASAGDPRFERFRGVVAQHRRNWPDAAAALARARKFDPSDAQVLYRLSQVLRVAGRANEAEHHEPSVRAMEAANREILPLYEEADKVKNLGTSPHPELYHRLAELRERMGLRDEALAWHRLVLRDLPEDPVSRAAVARLSTPPAD
jgi:tetratricopeptide (TPR) repeat protein